MSDATKDDAGKPKAGFETRLAGLADDQFKQAADLVDAERKRRAGDDIDRDAVYRMSDSEFEVWRKQQGRKAGY